MNKRVLLVTVDHHFIRTPDGNVWVKGIHDVLFWRKYLASFDRVLALVRIKDGSYDEVQNWILSSCEGVEFCGVPFFQGPLQYLRRYYFVNRKISEIVRRKEITCAVFRVPSTIGFSAFHKFKKTGKPCGLEVVANFKDRSLLYTGICKSGFVSYDEPTAPESVQEGGRRFLCDGIRHPKKLSPEPLRDCNALFIH